MGIISIRVSADIPVQSSYLPLISLFFLMNLLFTFISFVWFVFAEQFRTKNYLPSFFINVSDFYSKIKRQFSNKINRKQPKIETTIDVPNKSDDIFNKLKNMNEFACGFMVVLMLASYLSIWLSM